LKGSYSIGAEGNAIAGLITWWYLCDTGTGDVVDIQVRRKRKKYMEGSGMRFLNFLLTIKAPRSFRRLGGCKWQHLPYDLQLF
jgi:23S rRNA (uracil1939-C5)-methyltransferase